MDEQFEIEELTTDEELELIDRMLNNIRIPFPAITISSNNIYFNMASSEFIPEYVKWFSTSTLIIGLPSDKNDKHAFHVKTYKSQRLNSTRYPSLMQDKKIAKGTYKLYKYKDGFAFKRYEPLEK